MPLSTFEAIDLETLLGIYNNGVTDFGMECLVDGNPSSVLLSDASSTSKPYGFGDIHADAVSRGGNAEKDFLPFCSVETWLRHISLAIRDRGPFYVTPFCEGNAQGIQAG